MTPREQFERLLRQLHTLMAAGKGDDAEADALRDEMDAPWYAMSDADREAMAALSVELYDAEEGRATPP